MGVPNRDRYVTLNASVTEAQREAVRRLAHERQVPYSVIVRDALRAAGIGAQATATATSEQTQPVAA